MLSKFVNQEQSNWDDLLPATVFAYNTSKHSSTCFSPFEMIHGFQPSLPIETELVLPKSTKPASEWVKEIHNKAELLKEAGLSRQNHTAHIQASYFDKGKRLKKIKVGDLVRVNMQQHTDPQSRKLGRLWKGPYKVIKRCGPVTFRVMDAEGFELNDAVHIDRMMLINDERQ